MGCFKLHIENEPRLDLAYSKKAQKPLKMDVSYYPFGLQQKGYNDVVTSNVNSVANRFGFGGKEYGEELGLDWYDVSARNYDPAIARWMNLDPLAETMRRHSPYNFGFNNPIFFQDYDGMSPSGPGKWLTKLKGAAKEVGNFIEEKTAQAGEYLAENGYEGAGAVVTATGEATNNMIENGVEGKVGFVANAKVSSGNRIVAGFKGLAGVDVNAGSVELFEAGIEKGFKENGDSFVKAEIDYLDKDGTNDATYGLTTSGLLLGESGYEGSHTKATGSGSDRTEDGEVTNQKHEVLGLISFGDVAYTEDKGEIEVSRSKGLKFSFGTIITVDIQLEAKVQGTAKIK